MLQILVSVFDVLAALCLYLLMVPYPKYFSYQLLPTFLIRFACL